MKVGDLVRMKDEPFMHKPYGLGFVMNGNSFRQCWVFFPDIVGPGFDGLKWCNKDKLEVISEVGS